MRGSFDFIHNKNVIRSYHPLRSPLRWRTRFYIYLREDKGWEKVVPGRMNKLYSNYKYPWLWSQKRSTWAHDPKKMSIGLRSEATEKFRAKIKFTDLHLLFTTISIDVCLNLLSKLGDMVNLWNELPYQAPFASTHPTSQSGSRWSPKGGVEDSISRVVDPGEVDLDPDTTAKKYGIWIRP